MLLFSYFASFLALFFKEHREMVCHLLAPVSTLIVVFSFLPHKEIRFIFYAVPLINTMAAVTCAGWTK